MTTTDEHVNCNLRSSSPPFISLTTTSTYRSTALVIEMPAISMQVLELWAPTKTLFQRGVSSSEAAALHGQTAKTPIIAGSICGGIMGIAWIIGFTVYFRKRYKRKMRKRKQAALNGPVEPKTEIPEKIIIPPDPAVISGKYRPGDVVIPPKHPHKSNGSARGSTNTSQSRINEARRSPSATNSHTSLQPMNINQAIIEE